MGQQTGERPLAMGCMRLSTAPDRDDERAIATLHAAFDAGVRFLDTADGYCRDDSEVGHNERLIARALASWSRDASPPATVNKERGGMDSRLAEDASRIRVATKGGLTRPEGRWVPDGRARHLVAACETSRRALGVERLDLGQRCPTCWPPPRPERAYAMSLGIVPCREKTSATSGPVADPSRHGTG